jgi:hypothetical protein
MTIKPLCLALRLKRYSYIMLPLVLVGGAIGLTLESRISSADPVDGVQTLVFLRHGEKPAGGLGQLNCQGLNRAMNLATVLPEKFGKANFVFAANPTRNVEEGEFDNSYSYIRPLMTISPSAIKLGLPVNIKFSANWGGFATQRGKSPLTTSGFGADLRRIRATRIAFVQALLVVTAQQRRLAVVPSQRQHIQRVVVAARPVVGDGVLLTGSFTGHLVDQLRQIPVGPRGVDDGVVVLVLHQFIGEGAGVIRRKLDV